MISRSFQTVRRMREAWKWETYVRSQSFSSESAVKYLHVGRRKIQISPPLGEQDQSNALPQGQKDNQIPTHALSSTTHPLAGITLIGALYINIHQTTFLIYKSGRQLGKIYTFQNSAKTLLFRAVHAHGLYKGVPPPQGINFVTLLLYMYQFKKPTAVNVWL